MGWVHSESRRTSDGVAAGNQTPAHAWASLCGNSPSVILNRRSQLSPSGIGSFAVRLTWQVRVAWRIFSSQPDQVDVASRFESNIEGTRTRLAARRTRTKCWLPTSTPAHRCRTPSSTSAERARALDCTGSENTHWHHLDATRALNAAEHVMMMPAQPTESQTWHAEDAHQPPASQQMLARKHGTHPLPRPADAGPRL